MRTRLVLCAALAALLAGCETTQIVGVEGDRDGDGSGNPPGTVGTPSTNGIDYTPRGGSGRVGTTVQLTAICGTSVCPAQQPFWTSDHPELIAVTGNSSTTVNGFEFRVGMSATLRFVSASAGTQVNICIQPSISVTSPKTCYRWTSTP